LQEVIVDNLDFREAIEKYDADDTLFYLDPPYPAETRLSQESYQYEMRDSEHRLLIDILLRMNGTAIISSYRNGIYDRLLRHGWGRFYREIHTAAHVTTRKKRKRTPRKEVLYVPPSVKRKFHRIAQKTKFKPDYE